MDLRLDDPDPHVRAFAVLAFLDDLFGRGFLVRWARMNDCKECSTSYLLSAGDPHPRAG